MTYFGEFGGSYVPKILEEKLQSLERQFKEVFYKDDFNKEFNEILKYYSGRPTPLYYAENLSKSIGVKLYLKREDLNHMGAHKLNNAIGQALLAKKMGKKRVIAETGAGQHGVACATVCAKFGLKCTVFMGELDIQRQNLNVKKMRLLGAEVISVKNGEKTLKEAVDAAIEYWVKNSDECFYMLGSVVGPSPYPLMVREFQKIIGEELYYQIKDQKINPSTIIACVGGGSNAMGIFYRFIEEKIELIAVEAAGEGLNTNRHAVTLKFGSEGVIHGMNTIYLQNDKGDPKPVYSIASGLDYPGVGPEIAYLFDTGRIKSSSVDDKEAINAFKVLCEKEGIIPAIESSHALAYILREKEKYQGKEVILNLSGRGDKDIDRIYDNKV